MSDFTYTPPDENKFYKAILIALARSRHPNLCEILKKAKCRINVGGTYSHSRWNALYTSVVFQIPMGQYESLSIDDEDKSILKDICNNVMPPEAGLEVMHVDITPLLYEEDR